MKANIQPFAAKSNRPLVTRATSSRSDMTVTTKRRSRITAVAGALTAKAIPSNGHTLVRFSDDYGGWVTVGEAEKLELANKALSTREDGTGGFRPGHLVYVRDEVRGGYAGRHGVVAVVTRVVPKEMTDALHAEGKLTNNGSHEIGVDFAKQTATRQLSPSAYFHPHELAPVIATSDRPVAPSRAVETIEVGKDQL